MPQRQTEQLSSRDYIISFTSVGRAYRLRGRYHHKRHRGRWFSTGIVLVTCSGVVIDSDRKLTRGQAGQGQKGQSQREREELRRGVAVTDVLMGRARGT